MENPAPRARRAILGTRIRQQRRKAGMTQVELARESDISASYLNLIEHNKRGVAGPLLRRIAKALSIPLQELDGASERQLLTQLEAIAERPELKFAEIEVDAAGEFIGRFPGWAAATATLARREHMARENAHALGERLAHDAFFSSTMHQLLSRTAAIRSATDIVTEFRDLDTNERMRFERIIHEESRSLTTTLESLVAYLDKAEDAGAQLTPFDDMQLMFNQSNNRFDALEQLASPASKALSNNQLNGRLRKLIDEQPQLENTVSQQIATQELKRYAELAYLLPLDEFTKRAASLHYDIERLAEHFNVTVDAIGERLCSLPEPAPRFGYALLNAASTVIRARNLPALDFPRYGSACPLWLAFRVSSGNRDIQKQRIELPDGARYVMLASVRAIGETGFDKPQHFLTDVFVIPESDANDTVYRAHEQQVVERVGHSCRSCPRSDCLHRVADPLAVTEKSH